MKNRPSVNRGTPREAVRQSLLNTPAWLPVVVGVAAVIVLDVVVPRSTKSGAATLAAVVGIAIAVGSAALLMVRWRARMRMRSVLRGLITPAAVTALSSLELHDLVLAALLRRHWHLTTTVIPDAPDGTVVMTYDRVRRAVFFVEAREPIAPGTLRELESTVRGKARALIISAAGFVPDSIVFARQIGVELVDAQGVLALMAELRGEATAMGALPSPTFVWEDEVLNGKVRNLVPASADKQCPTCGGPMRAQQNATTRYWACTKFPDCSGLIITQ